MRSASMSRASSRAVLVFVCERRAWAARLQPNSFGKMGQMHSDGRQRFFFHRTQLLRFQIRVPKLSNRNIFNYRRRFLGLNIPTSFDKVYDRDLLRQRKEILL